MKKEDFCDCCGAYVGQNDLKKMIKRNRFGKILITVHYCIDCKEDAKEVIDSY